MGVATGVGVPAGVGAVGDPPPPHPEAVATATAPVALTNARLVGNRHPRSRSVLDRPRPPEVEAHRMPGDGSRVSLAEARTV